MRAKKQIVRKNVDLWSKHSFSQNESELKRQFMGRKQIDSVKEQLWAQQ